MHIDQIELFHVAMPLLEPWRTAYGEDSAVHSVLCKMSAEGIHGWGESSPLAAPCYSPEWGGGIFAVAEKWLAPAVVGHDVSSGEQLQTLLAVYKGNPFAKAALDTAWWHLHARQLERPLHEVLGGKRDTVPVGADFGVKDSIEELLEAIQTAVDARFPRIKLKYRPGWDLPMVRAVRERFPDQTFHIDCNSGYTLDDLPMFQELDQFGLAMFEQPLAHDDVLDHAALQRQVRTPVCLDESIVNRRATRQAIAQNSCRIVNIKPGRVGGLTPAVAIHNDCQAAGISCWVGGMLESAVGGAICVALATLDNFTYPADIFPSSRFYATDLADPPLTLCYPDGTPHIQALAVAPEPDPERLARCRIQQAVIR